MRKKMWSWPESSGRAPLGPGGRSAADWWWTDVLMLLGGTSRVLHLDACQLDRCPSQQQVLAPLDFPLSKLAVGGCVGVGRWLPMGCLGLSVSIQAQPQWALSLLCVHLSITTWILFLRVLSLWCPSDLFLACGEGTDVLCVSGHAFGDWCTLPSIQNLWQFFPGPLQIEELKSHHRWS